jgi:hypothetical protein
MIKGLYVLKGDKYMKVLLKIALGIPVLATMIASPLLSGEVQAAKFFVSYPSETQAQGTDPNSTLTSEQLKPFVTSKTLVEYYNYVNSIFNGPGNGDPIPSFFEDTSHLFLVQGSDGLGLFVVHGKPDSTDAGLVRMQLVLNNNGVSADFLVEDDPIDQYSVASNPDGSQTFTAYQGWNQNKSDGFAIAYLQGRWSVEAQFVPLPPPNGSVTLGINRWVAISSMGEIIELDPEVGNPIIVEAARTPESSAIIGLVTASLLGGVVTLKHRKSV